MPGGLSPIERSTSNGLGSSPIAKIGSTHSAIGGGDALSSNWNPPPASSSRFPSIKPPHSRTQSIYGGDGDLNSSRPPKSAVDEHRQSHLWDNPAPPISPRPTALDAILDRPRSGYSQIGDQSRSHTPFGGSRPRTPVAHEPSISGRVTPGITRSNTPFIDRPKSGVEGSFFDRPKSAFGGGSIYGDSGPAMFGDSGPAADIGTGAGTSLFGDPPASVFGDVHAGESGEANDGWAATEREQVNDGWDTAKGEEANGSWGGGFGPGPEDAVHHMGDTAEGGTGGNWNMPEATIEPVEVPVEMPVEVPVEVPAEVPVEVPAATPSAGKKGKSKRKNSTAISTPVSGLASRASPVPSTKKSPFGNTPDAGFPDDPTPAFLAVDTGSISPAADGGGLWGSKAPSPKPLSPLNPASQMDHDPSTTVRDEVDWGFDTAGGASAITGGQTGTSNEFGFNDVNLGDTPTKTPSRAPSPVPPVPEEPSAWEKEPVTTGKGKKKKKGSTATTPAKSPHTPTQEAADREEEERARAVQERLVAEAAEADRLAAEALEAARLQEQQRLAEEAAAAARLQDQQEQERAENQRLELERIKQEKAAQEQVEKELERVEQERLEQERLEQERLEQERLEQERLEQERLEQERLEQERLAQEEKDKAAAAAAATPVSAFSSDPPALFSGGLFSSSSLNPPDKPWMMSDTGGGDDGWAGGWGATGGKKKKTKLGATVKPSTFGSWGGGVFGESTPAETETISPADGLTSSQDPGGLFSFSSTTPNLSFGFNGDSTKPISRVASPVPMPAVDEVTSTPAETEANPTDVVSPTAENNEAPGEEETFATSKSSKKKKKKGDKGGPNVTDTATGTETPKDDTLADLLALEEETPAETVETPVAETPTTGGAAGRKKKKGKK
ncbi:hypothetical protein BYT27DRAFT_6544173 [Phlegmacium glaucopus]|nr:hypothetical protein BYT27DRAFT_6544173 [Phlegmacium glaucopus]